MSIDSKYAIQELKDCDFLAYISNKNEHFYRLSNEKHTFAVDLMLRIANVHLIKKENYKIPFEQLAAIEYVYWNFAPRVNETKKTDSIQLFSLH